METLKKKKEIELKKLLNEKKEALRSFRFGLSGSKVKNIKEGRNLRKDIAKIKRFADLPKNAKNYINFVEKFIKIPVKLIGVGPNRHEIIKK